MLGRPILLNKNVLGKVVAHRSPYRTFTNLKSVTAEEYQIQQKNVKRPWSPHVTIYKFPLPAWTSITHRATGIVLTGIYGSLGLLTLTYGAHEVPLIVDSIKNFEPALVPLMKFGVAFPITYHTLFGIRHLYWDRTANGIDLETVYSTSKLLLGATAVISGVATFL